MRKFLLIGLPMILCIILDWGLTLWGQSDAWWREYLDVNELNPVGRVVLALGPRWAIPLTGFYVGIMLLIVMQFKHQYAAVVCIAVSVGHMIGAHSWLVNYTESYAITRCFVAAAGILAACVTEYLIFEIRDLRTPAYMSPTSLKTAENNWDEYYIKYLADVRAPRLPQTAPMSVGSAFDAYVKSFLHFNLFGNYGEGDAYAKDSIFEKQVEPHNRDWARLAGQYTFDCYKKCEALADLMLELGTAINAPRFEFDLLGTVETSVGDVPLMGKPDIYFINGEGGRVILDWKVNGYCGKSVTSPMSGYVMIRDAWTSERKRSSGDRMPYKDTYPTVYKGIKINAQDFMEKRNEEWAAQLSIYAWLLGEEVGSQDLITGIDQIVGQPGAGVDTYKVLKPGDMIPTDFQHQKPFLRVASHRLRVGASFQHELLCRLASVWGRITSGHIFSELSREESDERCRMLDEQSAMFANPDDPMADFINSTRSQ